MRRLSPLAALLVLCLVLAGCGGEASAGTLSDAAAKTREAGSSKMAVDVNVTGATAQAVHITGLGTFDYNGGKGTLDLDLPIGTGQTAKIQSIIDGKTIYQKFPAALAARLPGKRPWLKYDVAKLEASGQSASALGQSNDPAQALNFLNGATGKVEDLGDESVRGEDTKHYRTTVDLNKAAAAAGAKRTSIDNLIKQSASAQVPTDVWLDGDGRVRRIRYTVDVKPVPGSTAAGAAATNSKVLTTLELFEFGTKVTYTLPPKAQVTDATEVLGKNG
jgi:hypothetical protein